MKNLKEEFKKICHWRREISKEEADTHDLGGPWFNRKTGCYYIEVDYHDEKNGAMAGFNDDDFDEFAIENGLIVWENEEDEITDHQTTIDRVEEVCDCIIKWNDLWECETVTFHPDEDLYVVASGIWGYHSNPPNTQDWYKDFLSEFDGSCSFQQYVEYDDFRYSYDDLKEIADKNPNWLALDVDNDMHVSGSAYLTRAQAERLEDVFYLIRMSELLEK